MAGLRVLLCKGTLRFRYFFFPNHSVEHIYLLVGRGQQNSSCVAIQSFYAGGLAANSRLVVGSVAVFLRGEGHCLVGSWLGSHIFTVPQLCDRFRTWS